MDSLSCADGQGRAGGWSSAWRGAYSHAYSACATASKPNVISRRLTEFIARCRSSSSADQKVLSTHSRRKRVFALLTDAFRGIADCSLPIVMRSPHTTTCSLFSSSGGARCGSFAGFRLISRAQMIDLGPLRKRTVVREPTSRSNPAQAESSGCGTCEHASRSVMAPCLRASGLPLGSAYRRRGSCSREGPPREHRSPRRADAERGCPSRRQQHTTSAAVLARRPSRAHR